MTSSVDAATTIGWWEAGERVLGAAVDRLGDADLAGPSRLPGWSRGTLLAHLARNADALVNLLTWARTGVETPMYASAGARDADILSTAAQPGPALRADAAAATARLDEAVAAMPAAAWAAQVRTAQGRTVAATEVPWMRGREAWVHAVDLDAGVAFADLPPDFCTALVDDVLALLVRREQQPAATFVATDVGRCWGSGAAVVRGPVTALAAWLTRGDASGLSGDPPVAAVRWL